MGLNSGVVLTLLENIEHLCDGAHAGLQGFSGLPPTCAT